MKPKPVESLKDFKGSVYAFQTFMRMPREEPESVSWWQQVKALIRRPSLDEA